jgi:hypothetical protein
LEDSSYSEATTTPQQQANLDANLAAETPEQRQRRIQESALVHGGPVSQPSSGGPGDFIAQGVIDQANATMLAPKLARQFYPGAIPGAAARPGAAVLPFVPVEQRAANKVILGFKGTGNLAGLTVALKSQPTWYGKNKVLSGVVAGLDPDALKPESKIELASLRDRFAKGEFQNKPDEGAAVLTAFVKKWRVPAPGTAAGKQYQSEKDVEAKADETARLEHRTDQIAAEKALREADEALAGIDATKPETKQPSKAEAATYYQGWRDWNKKKAEWTAVKTKREERVNELKGPATPAPTTRPGVPGPGGAPTVAGQPPSVTNAGAPGAAPQMTVGEPISFGEALQAPEGNAFEIQPGGMAVRHMPAAAVDVLKNAKGQVGQVAALAGIVHAVESGYSVRLIDQSPLYSQLHPEDKQALIRWLMETGKLRSQK